LVNANPRVAGMARLLGDLYEELPGRFRPERAQGLKAVIQLMVTDSSDDCAFVEIGPDECLVSYGVHPDADAVVHCIASDLRDLLAGRISAIELFSEGRMTIEGSVAQAARVYSLLHHSRIS
jgi:putative sterol carrier protein